MKLAGIWTVLFLAACEGKAPPATKTPESRPTACVQDSDCVISCDTRDGCCHDPCCETAMLASEQRAIADYNHAHCPKDPQCPVVGGCVMDYDVRATCKAGTCVAEKTPRNPPEPVDAPPDALLVDAGTPVDGGAPVRAGKRDPALACKIAADCAVYNSMPCNHCACSDTPISKKALARKYKTEGLPFCEHHNDEHLVTCPPCHNGIADCVDGQCVAK